MNELKELAGVFCIKYGWRFGGSRRIIRIRDGTIESDLPLEKNGKAHAAHVADTAARSAAEKSKIPSTGVLG